MSNAERREPQEGAAQSAKTASAKSAQSAQATQSPKQPAWAAGDDRPNLRPLREPSVWPAWVLAIAVIAGAGAYGWYQFYGLPAFLEPYLASKSAPRQAPQPQAQAAPPAVRYPIEGPSAEAAANLPTLENSDSLMRKGLATLLGRPAFERFVVPDRLVRRIVATIDNLPRSTAPRRLMPVTSVPGAFVVDQQKGERSLTRRNFSRYEPFVAVTEALDANALARFYAENYPLFQRAYDELGFGGRNFNDRVVETIDDLLAAPAPALPIRLERRKVLDEFADPELEALSAGRKMMIRMGPQNAARVKAKLREVREALVAGKPAS
jgi:hypothetical protein